MTEITNKLSEIKDFFDENKTINFVKQIEYALQNLNLDELEQILKDYGIFHFEPSQDFIGQLRFQLTSLKNEGKKLIALTNTKPRLSKCIGCSFGCTIKAFKYEYQHRVFTNNSNSQHYDVVYENEFGILLKIENKILIDLGVCNAFLTEKECNELK